MRFHQKEASYCYYYYYCCYCCCCCYYCRDIKPGIY